MASGQLFPRMLRAAKLESQLYEEVEADQGGTGQALLAVLLVSLSTGIGHGITGLMKGGAGGVSALFIGLFSGLIHLLAALLLAGHYPVQRT